MNETQQSIGDWIERTFPGGDPASPRKSLRLLEEVIELCLADGASVREIDDAIGRALSAEGRAYEARRPEPGKVPAEAADTLIVLYGLAALKGFDLHAEVDRKMAVNRHERTWIANGDGTGYHRKDTEARP